MKFMKIFLRGFVYLVLSASTQGIAADEQSTTLTDTAQLDLTPPGYHALNYGFDKIRWIAPVPVDSRVRATFTAGGVKNRISGQPGYVVQYDVSLEVEGLQRPAMVAQWLGAIVPDADTAGGD